MGRMHACHARHGSSAMLPIREVWGALGLGVDGPASPQLGSWNPDRDRALITPGENARHVL